MRACAGKAICLVLLMLFSAGIWLVEAPQEPQFSVESQPLESSSRALTIWSGTVDVNGDYTVSAGDELRIQPGTTVRMGPGIRVYVEGKVVAAGTQLNPISVEIQSGFTWHDGFQFNATSRNRGSSMRNVTFEDAQFALTIEDSNPVLEDIYIDNPDLVGIDLFDSANPVIRRLTVQDGGQDVHGSMTHWRYGIGLSVGAGSAPFVDGATFDNQLTRAISYWGGSGGVLRNINITNVGGATLNISAAIFIEDSIPLVEDVEIDSCDNGIYVIHATDDEVTRPVFRRATVANSQYRGVMVTKDERWNFSTYLMGRFHDLEVYGTGGPNAPTPGLGIASIFLNTSGAWFENVDVHDNAVNGIKLYMTDPSTTFVNVSIDSSGATTGGTNDRAGLFSRSSNIGGPALHNLTVSNSPGTGIYISKGSLSGSDWHSHDNGGEGLYISELFPTIDDVLLEDNGRYGLRVYDSKQVWISNLTTLRNGFSVAGPNDGGGMRFIKSNDLMSDGNIVRCTMCTSQDDNWVALAIEDSVDIKFEELTIRDPVLSTGQSPISIDDSGMQWDGWIEFEQTDVWANTSGGAPAFSINQADVRFEGLNLQGSHSGIQWTGRNQMSKLSNSTIVGSNCLTISDIPILESHGLTLPADCNGAVSISNSEVNLTDASINNATLAVSSGSQLRWISSATLPANTISASSTIDVMWFVDMWAVNQYLHGLPWASVNLTFSQFEPAISMTMPYSGNAVLGPFIGQRHLATGSSAITDVSTDCNYDNTTSTTGPDTLSSDLIVLCTITLTNQPPFIIWDEPLNQTVVSSGAPLTFNASNSWDLDNDPLTYSWESNIDGPHTTFCQGQPGTGNLSVLEVNNANCQLTDGVHQITLTLCDDQGNCVSETRTIEFVNLPPEIYVFFSPDLDWDGVLRVNFTQNVHINASNTTDPEGDLVMTGQWTDYEQAGIQPAASYPLEWNRTFETAPNRQFTHTVAFSDGLNPTIYYNISVEVQNEFPHPSFSVARNSNISEAQVTLDGSASFDPEGDVIEAWWHSSLDGDLATDPLDPLQWVGTLSHGTHILSLRLSDDDSWHSNQWSQPYQVTLEVLNSPPRAQIASPTNGMITDSATLLTFSGLGSGDWDAPCDEAFAGLSGWWCNPDSVATPDTVSPIWTSNLETQPLGTDWEITARLPAGSNIVNLTVSDGINPSVIASISIEVGPSAPILILASPDDGIEVVSDEVVLFDPQMSWDPDGDNFTFTVTSDLLAEPVLDAVDPAFWYSRYIPAGEHTLTFTLTDETNMSRSETRSLSVLASPPVATISAPIDGQSYAPGAIVSLVGEQSWDADGDIILYRWFLGQGASAQVLNETANGNQTLPPGTHLISLQVKDSRGASSWAFTNVSVENSWPLLTDLILEPGVLQSGESETITARLWVEDADMTTWECLGWASQGGIETEFKFNDNATGADSVAGDGTWSGRVTVTPGREGWMNIEAICRDGPQDDPRLSNRVSETIQVEGAAKQSSFLKAFTGSLGPLVLTFLALLVMGGVAMTMVRRKQLAADIEMIESWGAASFAELDDELLSEIDDEESVDLSKETEPKEDEPLEEGEDDDIPPMEDL